MQMITLKMNRENKPFYIFGGIIFILCLILLLLNIKQDRLVCEGNITDELYYFKQYPNVTGDVSYDCIVRNRTEDNINFEKRQLEYQLQEIELEIKKKCYDEGKDYNKTFDLNKDYGFTCKKIEYINNHFIDEVVQKDGGSISVMNVDSGFLSYSSNSIDVQLYDYVVVDVLATGKIPKFIEYHLDCENSTLYYRMQTICQDGKIFPDETSSCRNGVDKYRDTMKVEYYTEGDFIMYYVDNCIGDEDE